MLRFEGPIETWREEIGRRVLKIDFTPADGREARLCYDLLLANEGVAVSRFRHSPGASFRDREIILGDFKESWTLLIPRTRPLHIVQGGREIDLHAGSATLLRNTEPGLVGAAQACDYWAFIVLDGSLAAAGAAKESLACKILHRNVESLRLLRSYASMLERGMPLSSDGTAAAAGRHIAELVALATTSGAIGQPEFHQGSAAREARLVQALAFMKDHHTDPALSVGKVAAQQRISTRYLHRIFEMAGLSFTDQLRELRLQHAHGELQDIRNAALGIADIAFRAGFHDISHFNRVFRRRFGTTPSGARSAAWLQAGRE